MSWYANLITSYCIIDADFLAVVPREIFAFFWQKELSTGSIQNEVKHLKNPSAVKDLQEEANTA